jgi:histidinol-phosphate phosphatase family protein
MQAVILAGGKGTRLKALTAEVPKPMVEIGGIPIIEHQIRLLVAHGITDILLIVNHLKQPLIDYVGDGAKFGASVTYFEEEIPLGTSGAFPLFKKQLQDTFLVLYGDVMMDMDLNRLIAFHEKKKADATLVVHPNDHPHDSDLVEMNRDNKIIAFHSKPHAQDKYYKNMVNAGAYVFTRKAIDTLPGAVKGDFGKDIFPEWIKTLNIFGYNTPEYLKDMGTLDRLAKVNDDLQSGKIARKNLQNKQKAIFLDRDGVLNEDNHLIHTPEELVLYPFTSDAIKAINQSDYLAIVVTNQSVVARNLCTIEELEYIHKKLDTELGQAGTKLDELYYCPYHPDKGYPEENPAYKMEHPWRKPSPGMLLQAAEDYNVDLSQSFMIGDRETDILAGKAAGCTTIAVRTGQGYKRAATDPDYIFANVKQAVDFIVNDPLEAHCETILSALKNDSVQPKIVLIGGNSQSGKSTLAKRLALFLQEKNIQNTTISLDHFLLPKEKRTAAKSVFKRFDLENIEQSISAFAKGEPITLERYHKDPKLDRQQIVYNYNQEEVIIIEGVVALTSEKLRNQATYRVFVDQKTEDYQSKFQDLYRWKGLSEEEIKTLLAERFKDEFEVIQKTQTFADLVIKPTLNA